MHGCTALIGVAVPDRIVGSNPTPIVHSLVEPVLPAVFADRVGPNLDRGKGLVLLDTFNR